MEPVTIALILSALSQAGSTGGQIYKSSKQKKHKSELEAYNKEMQDKSDKEARRASMARAIGAKDNRMYRPDPDAPGEPDFTGIDTGIALGNLAGQLGSMYAGAQGGIKEAATPLSAADSMLSKSYPRTGYGYNNGMLRAGRR